jgi:IS5 family transposase
MRPQTGRLLREGSPNSISGLARARQADPVRGADYRATRPKVERKLAHLVRRRHGGRRVRVRGLGKVAADFTLLAAAVNLARLGVLGLHWTPLHGWAAL